MGRKGEKHSIARALYASFVSMRACMLSHFSHVQPFMTPWTVAYQAPVSMGFSRQGSWSGLPFPSPEYVAEVEYFLGFLFMPFEWTKKRLFSGSHHEMMAHFPHTSSFKEQKGILRLRNHLSWILPGFYLQNLRALVPQGKPRET